MILMSVSIAGAHLLRARETRLLHELGTGGLTTYLHMLDELEDGHDTFAPAAELAKRSGQAERTLYRALEECEALGLIVKKWTPGESRSAYGLGPIKPPKKRV